MELKPTKAQILWLAEKYNTVPLSTTLPATVTPTQVLQKLKTDRSPLVPTVFPGRGAKHRKHGRNHCRLFSLRRRS